MPRKARVVLPNYPHHVVQRGHNRRAVFIEEADYQYYLENLAEWKTTLGCKVYGYCLMTNHVHLIVNPGEQPESLGLLVKRLAGRQTRLVNRVERRTGSLWDGRYKSSAIETDSYLMTCCRYVELNPVRAGMVSYPADYCWSSYRRKVGLEQMDWLDIDPCFAGLAETLNDRQKAYAAFVARGMSERELVFIRQAIQRCQLTGSNRFIDEVEERFGHRLEFRGQGRPMKSVKVVE
jgi:putative transposase